MLGIDSWVEQLQHDNSSLVIVEGQKDKRALNKLGIENVYSIDRPIYLLVENIAEKNKQVIILTDFDKTGRSLYFKIKHDLQRNGIKVNDKYRKFLSRCKITHVEGLFTYYKNNSKEVL